MDNAFRTLALQHQFARSASATNRDAARQDFDSLQAELGHAKGSVVTRKHYIRLQDKQKVDSAASYNDYLEKLRAEAVIQSEGDSKI